MKAQRNSSNAKLKRNSQRSELATKEIRQGVTCQTAFANTHISDIVSIPGSISCPATVEIEPSQLTDNMVFCDTETFLSTEADIVQIAALRERKFLTSTYK